MTAATEALAATAAEAHALDWTELEAARDRDATAREQDRPLTPDAFRDRCLSAVRWALPNLPDGWHEDVAQDLALNVAQRHGWTPRPSDVARTFLGKRAVALWRDRPTALQPSRADSLNVPAGDGGDADRTDFLTAASGAADRTPLDVGADAVADALLLTHKWDRAAVAVALSTAHGGKGDAVAQVADQLGVTLGSAEVQLTRARKRIRDAFPTAADLIARLQDSDAADRPLQSVGGTARHERADVREGQRHRPQGTLLTAGRDADASAPARARIPAEARAVRSILDRMLKPAEAAPHVTPWTHEDRDVPPSRTDLYATARRRPVSYRRPGNPTAATPTPTAGERTRNLRTSGPGGTRLAAGEPTPPVGGMALAQRSARERAERDRMLSSGQRWSGPDR